MAHFAYALLSFLAAQACVWWNNWLLEQMIQVANAHRPADSQISSAFRNRKKTNLIEQEYRHFCPHGRIPMWRQISLTLGFAFFLLTAIFFFRPAAG